MEDLHGQHAAARRDTHRPAALRGGRDHAGARCAVDVVALHLVEGMAKELRPRVEVPGIVVGQEEVAPVAIGRRGVGVLPDARLEIRMVDVDAVVQHRDDDGALAAGDLPGLAHIDVLVLLRATRAAIDQVPLRRGNPRHREAPVLRDEVRRREHHVVERRPRVGDLEQLLARVLPVRVIHHDLVTRPGIAPAHDEAVLGQDAASGRLRHLVPEAHDDLAVDDAQRPARLVPERDRRRSLRRHRGARVAGTTTEVEEAARRMRDQCPRAHGIAARIGGDLDALVACALRRGHLRRQRRELDPLPGLGDEMHGVSSARWRARCGTAASDGARFRVSRPRRPRCGSRPGSCRPSPTACRDPRRRRSRSARAHCRASTA